MENKIYKKKDKLIIEVPLKAKRYNPYEADFYGKDYNPPDMDNIVGVIASDEIGFAYWIDREYKDKGDDISCLFYNYWKSKEDFIKLCKKLGIECYEYPICGTCGKSIFGTFGFDKDGKNLCYECELKQNEKNE